jgi:transcriptional regulator with XRE-family HTH domain
MAQVELGERIATLREEQALTQAELAERARISPSTLSQIESGRVPRPHVGTIRKIARALNVEPQALRRAAEPVLEGKGEAPQETGPPRVSKERLQEHFEDVRQNEVDHLNWVIEDLWRLALPDEKPIAYFPPGDVDTHRVWTFLEHAFSAGNVFVPKERERLNRGARKLALAGRG